MCPDHGSPTRSMRFIISTRGPVGSSWITAGTPARRRPSSGGRTSRVGKRAIKCSTNGDMFDHSLRCAMPTREYDLVLLGATGFTGGLVAGYLAEHGHRTAPLKWALVGRNRDKLDAVSSAHGGVPVIVADALDAAAMAEVAHRTRVICTTAG